MRRDVDLVRTILQQVEEHGRGRGSLSLTVPGHTDEEVSYHVKLLHEAGLLQAMDASTMHGLDWMPKCLTWEGHEFLDAVRNDTVWNKVKTTVVEKGGGFTLEVLKQLAVQYLKNLMLPGHP
jgi:hypothetical protein